MIARGWLGKVKPASGAGAGAWLSWAKKVPEKIQTKKYNLEGINSFLFYFKGGGRYLVYNMTKK